MTRTLSWTVGDDMSLSPHGVQDAGVQGDHNATVIEFAIPEDDFGGKTMYIELTDSTGGYDKTDALTPENHKVSFPLPLAWTQAGGEATVRLVVTDGEDEQDAETAYSFAGRIRFDTRAATHPVDSLIKGAIHWLMEKAAAVLTTAETAATTATAKAAIASTAASGASQSATLAASSASTAAGSASTASNAASGAGHYADLASASASSAAASSYSAGQSAIAAESAKENACTAANEACTSAATASTAASAATGASASAVTAASTATAAASAATGASASASSSASDAASSAAAAEASAREIESGNYAKTDGYYGGMTVGTAENLIDTKAVGTPRTFSFDTACGDASITDDGTGTIAELSGNTVVWNQIFNKTGAGQGGVSTTYDAATGIMTMNGTMTGTYFQCGQFADDVIVSHNGHRMLTCARIIRNDDNLNIMYGAFNQQNANTPSSGYFRSGVRWSAIWTCSSVQSSRKNYMGFFVQSGVGTVVSNLQVRVLMFDLTAMFGAGNEPTSAAQFAAMFPRDDYARDLGTLLNFSGTGLKTVGFNAFHNGEAELLGGHDYQITGVFTALTLNGETVSPSPSGRFTPAENGTLTVTGWDDTTCVHLVWSGYRDGEHEEYWENTLSLPVAQYFPSGMKSAGTVHDSLFADKAVTRVGTRAYQSGDESDPTVTTDGTHTNYALATPVTVSIAPPLNLHYKVADFGTEQLLPANGAEPTTSPLVGTVRYSADYPREIANLPRNFLGTASLDSLLTVLGTQLGGTFTRTYNPTAGRYDFAFTPRS